MLHLALLLLTAFSTVSSAATPQPGRGATLPVCEADPGAACWEKAPRFQRFETPAGIFRQTSLVDVRLAWNEAGLLVRAEGLPPGSHLELTLERDHRDNSPKASSGDAGEGLTLLSVDPALKAGQVRGLHLLLVHAEGQAAEVQSWTPAGPVELYRSFPVAFAPAGATPEAATIELGPSKATITGADLIVARMVEPYPGFQYRGTPDPWVLEGEGSLNIEAWPSTGWAEVESRWLDARDRVRWLEVRRAWVAAPLAVELEDHGLHPPPRWLEASRGDTFTLTRRTRIAVEDPLAKGAATWLAAEVERWTGVAPEVIEGRGRKGDLRLVPLSRLRALSPDGRSAANKPEGFGLVVDSKGATIGASDRGGFTWGAVALSQLLADGQTEPLAVADHPELAERIVYHLPNVKGRQDLDADATLAFITGALVPGRINLLMLNVGGRIKLEGHPELGHSQAWTRAELRRVIDEAAALGIEVVPAVSTLSHSNWITPAWPQLTEDVNSKLLCTRHPQTYPLLAEVYEEILQIWGGAPRYFHIGHDEAVWKTGSSPAGEQCPRCAGTPRWRLMANDLDWHLRFFQERGVTPVVWSDMFVEGFNGGKEGAHRALDVVSPELLAGTVWMSWGRLGETVEVLGPQGRGFQVIRAHTGYRDHKRDGLEAQVDQILGEGLALFVPAPWSTLSFARGTRPLDYHFAAVVLNGATAWRPELSRVPISEALLALANHPAYLPGRGRADLGGALPTDGLYRVLPWTGEPASAVGVPGLDFGEHDTVGGIEFHLATARTADLEHPMVATLPGGKRLLGISLLQGIALTWDAERAIRDSQKSTKTPGGEPVAQVVLTYEGGESWVRPIVLGLDTERIAWDSRAVTLWNTSGSLALGSPEATSSTYDTVPSDRRLYRLDVVNPHPDRTVVEVRVEVLQPGVKLLAAGVGRPATAR